MTLHNFIEMLKTFFEQEKITISMPNKKIEIKNELFLSTLILIFLPNGQENLFNLECGLATSGS